MSTADEFEVFVRVVEEGSFTAAAHALSMPKSSISRYIARLEGRLGVRLLNRTTRSLSTTEAGAGFYLRCVRIVADIADAEAALSQGAALPSGPLSLSAPAVLAPWLGAVVCDFLTSWPQVQLTAAISEHADIVLSEHPPEGAVSVQSLPGTARILCASPAYLDQHPAPTAPADLTAHACLLLGRRPAGTWALPGGMMVSVSGPLAASDSTMLRAAALAGLGIAWLPRVVVAEALAGGALVALLDAHTRAAMPLLVATNRPSAAAGALVDLLRARL